MTEQQFQDTLAELLEIAAEHDDECMHGGEQIKRVSTFEEEGVLTNNKGLIISLKDGTSFQVTIVKSR